MVNRKVLIYRQVKNLANRLNLPTGAPYRRSTIPFLAIRLTGLRREEARRRRSRRKNILWRELTELANSLNLPVGMVYRSSTVQSIQESINDLRRLAAAQEEPDIRAITVNFTPMFDGIDYRQSNWQELKNLLINATDPDNLYYISFITTDNEAVRMNVSPFNHSNRDKYFLNLTRRLSSIYDRPGDYSIVEGAITLQLIEDIDDNPPIENQREGFYNCVCSALLAKLYQQREALNPENKSFKYKKNSITKSIKRVKDINSQVLEDGVSDEQFKELAMASEINISVHDIMDNKWREYKYDKNRCTLLLQSHNNHCEPMDASQIAISRAMRNDDYKTCGDYEQKLEYYATSMKDIKIEDTYDDNQIIRWVNSDDELLEHAKKLVEKRIITNDFISKGKLIAISAKSPEIFDMYYQGIPEDFTHEDPFSDGFCDCGGNCEFCLASNYRDRESVKVSDHYMDQVGQAFMNKIKTDFKKPTSIVIKKKFYEYVKYPHAFTDASVGKAKFQEQHPNLKSTFTDIGFQADQCGFYMRRTKSSKSHFKYDQNKSYLTASKGIKYPIIDCVLEVNKPFSECDDHLIDNDGLVLIDCPKLTLEQINAKCKIYFEGRSWQPIDIVRNIYMTEDIDPMVLQFANAIDTFEIDTSKFTNNQFRSFLGKCSSTKFNQIWRTYDVNEFLRARYILKDKIVRVFYEDGIYSVEYESDKTPWQFPIIPAMVKCYQKYTLFQQYNKLIDNDILPVCISVDGIETKENCDHLFDIRDRNDLTSQIITSDNHHTWKHENVYIRDLPNMVIERDEIKLTPRLSYGKAVFLPKLCHISGSAGNGKTQMAIELSKQYPNICYMATTNLAVKNLKKRADELNCNIANFTTYHKVFGIGCRANIPNASHFLIEEASMLSADDLQLIDDALREKFDSSKPFGGKSIILVGDFAQIPAVNGGSLYNNWTGEKSPLYELFTEHKLTKNWRQKADPKFFKLCEKTRSKLSKKDLNKLIKKLNTRYTENLPSVDTLDDMYICGTNLECWKANNTKGSDGKYVPSKILPGDKVICNMQCSDKNKRTIHNGEIGICIENIKGSFKVQWEDGAISQFKGIGKTKSKKKRFTIAKAITIHKAQGRTVKGNLIINPRSLFARNQLYVAISRATSLNNIYFTHKITPQMLSRTVRMS